MRRYQPSLTPRPFCAPSRRRRAISTCGRHDWRLCDGWHNENDHRRNPYDEPCLLDEALNSVEQVYHPLSFRTKFCEKGARCPFGSICSFAHGPEELRSMSEAKYSRLFPSPAERRPAIAAHEFLTVAVSARSTLGNLARVPSPTLGWGVFASSAPSQAVFIALLPFERCLVSSPPFWKTMQDLCLSFLCKIERHRPSPRDPEGLRLIGANAHAAEAYIQDLVRRPPVIFVSRLTADFPGKRVVRHIEERLECKGRGCFSEDQDTWVNVEPPNRIVVRALRSGTSPGQADVATQAVISKIKFWVQQEGYDKFTECLACCDEYNRDEGIACPKGHFFCCVAGSSNDACFVTMLEGELPKLKAQKAHALPCPVCTSPFDTKAIATVVPKRTWSQLEEAVIDAKLESRTEKLQREFDERLNNRLQELIANQGNMEAMVKLAAEGIAKQARDAILNLKCPHCKAAYAEFEGCLALKCSSCNKYFCGCCHKKSVDSRSCHEHVRECDLNPTTNGSFYADTDQIHAAQKRYRIKEMKRFLRTGHNKAEQNAAVLELQQDLQDLKIDPASLLNFDGAELGI
jgi:flagellar hook-basal body complex protein FliE